MRILCALKKTATRESQPPPARVIDQHRTHHLAGQRVELPATIVTGTLEAGDVLWMGTDLFSPDLKSGDTVDVEITGLGVLTNRFVRAAV